MKASLTTRPSHESGVQSTAQPRRQGNRSPGRPLPQSVREPMERSFGHEFSSIRIHEDDMAEQVGATAFARGDHLHFRPGTFRPWSSEGRRLISHELAHVRQRREGRVRATGRVAGLPLNDQPSLEQEADRWGAAAAGGGVVAGGPLEAGPAASPVGPAAPVQGWWGPFWKYGLERQMMKGTRDPRTGQTTGVILGPRSGDRQKWPASMKRKPNPVIGTSGNAEQERVGRIHAVGSEWGHQIAHQFGGGEKRQNAAAVSRYQEERQTSIEEAISDLIENHGVQRHDLRIKHTAYLHPGTRSAKYMRIKVYRRNVAGDFEKKIDHITKDNVGAFAAHGPGSRAAFRADMLQSLQAGPALNQKRGTAPAVVTPTSNMANTPVRPPVPRAWWKLW